MVILNWKQNKNFWNKVDIKGPNDCWNWQGSLNRVNGYGQFRLGEKLILVHKLSYLLKNELKNLNNFILHTCDNPQCVNPNHLYEGTREDNTKDMSDRKRSPQGRAKLNEECIKVIKWMLKNKHKHGLAAKLARLHNVHTSVISRINTNKIWYNVKI